MDKFYLCRCFFIRNYFVKCLNAHVIYEGNNDFCIRYEKLLQDKGITSQESFSSLLKELEQEYHRRCSLGEQSLARSRLIQTNYVPVHSHLFKLQDDFFDPGFLDIASYCMRPEATRQGLLASIERLTAEEVYSFPVFTKSFCDELLQELANFEQTALPKGRPNTMNNYGILLNELGFDEDFLIPLRTKYIQPITKLLYPEWGGDCLDSHKAFVVTYKMDQDESLDYHFDNAEITLNISLDCSFEEGSLYFGNMRTDNNSSTPRFTECVHRQTYGILHRGQHRHGALPITSGERHNLIIWMRSSKIRNTLCPMCGEVPNLVESVGHGDGFTANKHVCTVV